MTLPCVSDYLPDDSVGPVCPEDPAHGPMLCIDGKWLCNMPIAVDPDGREVCCEGSAVSDEDAKEAHFADRHDDERAE